MNTETDLVETLEEKVEQIHAFLVLRLGVGLTMLLAGFHKQLVPDQWAAWMAPIIRDVLIISPTTFMQAEGMLEIIVGALILVNVATAAASAHAAVLIAGVNANLMISLLQSGQDLHGMLHSSTTAILIRDIGLLLLALGLVILARHRPVKRLEQEHGEDNGT